MYIYDKEHSASMQCKLANSRRSWQDYFPESHSPGGAVFIRLYRPPQANIVPGMIDGHWAAPLFQVLIRL